MIKSSCELDMTFLLSIVLWVSPRKKSLVKNATVNGTKPVSDQMLRRANSWKETRRTQDQRGQVHNVHRIVVRLNDASPDFRRSCSRSSDRAKDLENLRRAKFIAQVFVQVPWHFFAVRIRIRLHNLSVR
jgi:hypothetical protein